MVNMSEFDDDDHYHTTSTSSSSALAKIGLYIDDESRLRVLDPQASDSTRQLVQECNAFVESSANFQSLVNDFVDMIDRLSASIEKAKIKAVGSRNALNSISNERDAKRRELELRIKEKSDELQRLKLYHKSLSRRESELVDVIETFTSIPS